MHDDKKLKIRNSISVEVPAHEQVEIFQPGFGGNLQFKLRTC